MHIAGCPVSVAEQILALVRVSGVKNPYFDSSQVWQFNKGYLGWKAKMALRRLRGKKYQQAGPCSRGAAKPTLSG